MATANRIFYAVKQVGITTMGSNTFTSVHGLQSVGINTTFNLEQVFEIGQISIYQNIENIPDVEVTLEKVLDGYPLIYHLATVGATSATLSGRQNRRATIGLSVYTDSQDSASGTPTNQCTLSGVYVSSLSYTFPTEGNCSEQVTFVGNNKVWNNTFTATAFNNNDTPSFASGVLRRQHVLMGSGQTKLPNDMPGIRSDNYNYNSGNTFEAHIQSIRISTNLGRDALYELGRRGPYFRYATFPVEVRTEIEQLYCGGNGITAQEDAVSNVTSQPIRIKTQDGGIFDLGTQNKMSTEGFGGGNAGRGGGNDTLTYTYITYNDFTITHPQDPSGL